MLVVLVILYGPVLVDSLYLISYTVMIPLGIVGGFHTILIVVGTPTLTRSDIRLGTVLRLCNIYG